jgi:DNA replication ATP-dependent helicase Dna2
MFLDLDVAYGILYYLETSKMIRIAALRREIIHMIIKRNEVACYARDRTRLPPMLENSHMCGKCFAQQSCFIYHKLLEDGTDEKVGPKGQFNDLIRHLRPSDQEFFKKWDSLLTKEEGVAVKIKRELWTMLSSEREKVGRCFSNVVLEPGSSEALGDMAKINRFRYTFRKQKATPEFSFAESQITVGEPIVVSDEKGHYALANGFVTSVRRRTVSVAVDRRLHNARTKGPGFDIDTNQVFAGIMEVGKERDPIESPRTDLSETVYRIDKDEFSNGMATVRNNLIQLMDDNVYKSSELRSLIIHDRAPIFTPPSSGYRLQTQPSQMSTNRDQKAAIEKVMSAKDYALVLGMPGTGKTTTIAQIIRALVAKGKSVLLTSYTHTAVDNILLKIRHDNIGILRLGAVAKVHPEVQQFATLGGQAASSLEELERNWSEPPVVATTCLGINHPIFSRRIFDYCIVDEASQITLPVCLGPIRMARSFVLVGDHHQLPPLVQNKAAVEGGLDVSLFKYLSERHPSAVVSLETQYRMCADVMALSNHLIYSGRLKCGNEAVANRSLMINPPAVRSALASCHWFTDENPDIPQNRLFMPPAPQTACPSPSASNCYLSKILKPDTRVLFLDTDGMGPSSHEQIVGQRIQNPTEATLIASIAATFVNSGVSASDIGVVTFFRSQLALLRRELQLHVPGQSGSGIELHTADRFQGRDKEIILVSCVRSNDVANVGELLKDWRRINVALTRARSKLVVVGSIATLANGDPVLKKMVDLCQSRGWIMKLPEGAGEAHYLEGSNTQAPTPTTIDGSSSRKSTHDIALQKRPSQSQSRNRNQSQRDRGSPVQKNSVKRLSSNGRKEPEKVGRVGGRAALSGRPILRDIVNEALGDIDMDAL